MKYTKYSKDSDVSYCFGIYPVIELLKNTRHLAVEIILSSKADLGVGIRTVLDLADEANVPVTHDDKIFTRLTSDESIKVIGVFKKFSKEIDKKENHVVLVNPSDMGNLGTIIRTCSAFNIKNLSIINPAADLFDPKVVRSSMGSLFSMNIQHFDSFEDYVFSNDKGRNYYLLMTDGEHNINTVGATKPYSLVFGSEGAGLDASYKKYGTTIYIPQSNTVDSLNLSIAVGISLFRFNC